MVARYHSKRPYVYVVLVDGVVRYVGKGRNERRDQHVKYAEVINSQRANGEKVYTTKFYNQLAKALREDSVVSTRILRWFNTDEEAFAYEIEAIAARKGLWNKLEGGNGFSSEYVKALWRTHPKLRCNQAKAASKSLSRLRQDADFNERLRMAVLPYRRSAKFKAEKAALLEKLRLNPEFVNRQAVAAKITMERFWERFRTDKDFEESQRKAWTKFWIDPLYEESRRKCLVTAAAGHRTKEYRQAAAERTITKFKDLEYRRNHAMGIRKREQNTDFVKRRNAAVSVNYAKFAQAHPEAASAIGRKGGTTAMAKLENRSAASERAKQLTSSPVFKEMLRRRNAKRWKDPIVAEQIKHQLAVARDRNNQDPAFQAKRLAGIQAYWERKRQGVV